MKKKCNVVHIKKGVEVQDTTRCKAGQIKIDCLEDGAHYIQYGRNKRSGMSAYCRMRSWL